MEMSRQCKQRKLNERRRSWPHVSAAALEAILKSCREEGVPEGNLDRNELRAARDLQNNEATPYGPISSSMEVVDKNGDTLSIPIANPFALLWMSVTVAAPWAAFLEDRLRSTPPTSEDPWSLILYTDGVTPGDPLTPMNKRKIQTCYWSFLELGANALSKEESWFTLMTELETVVAKVSAGLSQLFACIIRLFFDSEGFNMNTVGVLLPFASGHIRLFCKLKLVLQDGLAHKQIWHSRGDNASKMCLLCSNLVTSSSNLVASDTTGQLKANVIEWKDLVLSRGVDIRNSARYLASMAATMPLGAFDELQQALGLTHHPHGILLNTELDAVFDPTKVYCHDWMHCLFVDGVFNHVIVWLFEVFIQSGKPQVYQVCSNYISNFVWPARLHGTHLHEIFREERKDKHRHAGHIKAAASDLLSLVAVLALFTQTVLLTMEGIGAAAHGACFAFLSLVEVIDLIRSAPRVTVAPAMMLAAVEKCLRMMSAEFGFDKMTPKFHWMLHFPSQLQKYKFMVNCFCLERKHRTPKRYCSEFRSITAGSSKSLLSEVTSHHLGQLSRPSAFGFQVGLVAGKSASKQVKRTFLTSLCFDGEHEVRTAQVARHSYLATCARNDIVLIKEESRYRAGKVQLHCEVDGAALSLVTVFTLIKHVPDAGYAVWKVGDEGATPVPTDCILEPVVYTKWEDDVICTLLPMEYR